MNYSEQDLIMDILNKKQSISMTNLVYLFIIMIGFSHYISSGDTSIDATSLLLINKNNFDIEFNDLLKAKFHRTFMTRPQLVRNCITALNTNLDKEKIDIRRINKKFSQITFVLLCMMNGLGYIYAQTYGETYNIFCEKEDTNCFNVGFTIKNSAYQEYIYAVVAPWIFVNFITLGACLFAYNQKAKKTLKHNTFIEQKKWEAASFLNSLQSGTYLPTQV